MGTGRTVGEDHGGGSGTPREPGSRRGPCRLRPGPAVPVSGRPVGRRVSRWARRTSGRGARPGHAGLADPGDVAVRAQQDARYVQLRGGVREPIDPVRPAAGRQASGAVQQQAASATQQTVEVALRDADVPHPAAEQVGARTEVVADAGRGDLLDEPAVHLVEVHQFGEQPAHGPRARFGGVQFHLGASVLQYVLGDRTALGLVGVQQCVRRPAADPRGQLPAEVERVLEAQVEPLPAGGRMDVCRVPGQQHPPDPVALGQPGGIPETGQPARRVHAEVGSGDSAQLPPEVLQSGRLCAVTDFRGGDHDAVDPRAEGPQPESLPGLTDPGHPGGDLLRGHPHFHLAHQRLVPRRSPGKGTPSSLRTVLRPPSQPTR